MKRQHKILNRLLSQEYVPSQVLANEFSVSSRTIREDLKILKEKGFPRGYKIINQPRLGFKLEIIDDELFTTYINYNNINRPPTEQAKMIAFIGINIAVTNNSNTLEGFAQQYYISSTKMKKQIIEIEKICSYFKVELKRDSNKLYFYYGLEENIRELICHFMNSYQLTNYFMKDKIDPYYTKISKIVSGVVIENNVVPTESTSDIFHIRLFLQLYRIQKGYILEDNYNCDYIKRYYKIASELLNRSIPNCSDSEIRYLANCLSQNLDVKESAVSSSLYAEVKQIIEATEKNFNIQFFDKSELSIQIAKILVKSKYRIEINYQLLNKEELKNKFSYVLFEYINYFFSQRLLFINS